MLPKPQFYKDLTRKIIFLEGCSWFKFNNLRLALGIAFKFYTSVAKVLKLTLRKFWGLIPTFGEVPGEKLVGRGQGGLFAPAPILNRVVTDSHILAGISFTFQRKRPKSN